MSYEFENITLDKARDLLPPKVYLTYELIINQGYDNLILQNNTFFNILILINSRIIRNLSIFNISYDDCNELKKYIEFNKFKNITDLLETYCILKNIKRDKVCLINEFLKAESNNYSIYNLNNLYIFLNNYKIKGDIKNRTILNEIYHDYINFFKENRYDKKFLITRQQLKIYLTEQHTT